MRDGMGMTFFTSGGRGSILIARGVREGERESMGGGAVGGGVGGGVTCVEASFLVGVVGADLGITSAFGLVGVTRVVRAGGGGGGGGVVGSSTNSCSFVSGNGELGGLG